MKRNIMLMGGKTHVISLPLKWIKKYNVKKGEELELKEEENKIIVSTEKVHIRPPIKINLEGANASVAIKNITNAYQLGYPELELIFSNTTTNDKTQKAVTSLNLIQETCDQLIGFEITDEKETFCRIKDVAGNSINEFKNILRKIFLMINTYGTETLKNIDNPKKLKELHKKHTDIRKYCNYCQRYLNIKGFENKTAQYNEILVRLLDVSRTYRFISKNQLLNKNKYSKETLKVLKTTIKLQEDFYKLFYKFSLAKASDITRKRIDIFKVINELSKKENSENLILIHRLPFILNTILSLMNTTIAINFKE